MKNNLFFYKNNLCRSILFGLLFLILGYLIFENTGNIYLYSFASFIICLSVGVYAARAIWKGNINIGLLLVSQIILWYMLPWIYLPFLDVNDLNVRDVNLIELAGDSLSIVSVSFFAALVFIAWKPIINLRYAQFWQAESLLKKLSLLFSLIQLVVFLSGTWGYSTVTGIDDLNSMPEWLQLIKAISYALPVVLAALLGQQNFLNLSLKKKYKTLGILIFCIIVQILWFSVMSRRTLIVVCFVSYIVYLRMRYQNGLTSRMMFPLFFTTTAILVFVYFSMSAYYTLRLATDLIGVQENLTIFDYVRVSQIVDNLKEEHAQNVFNRPFGLIESFHTIKKEMNNYLYGWNILSQVLMVIPSILFPEKLEFIGPTLETLWGASIGVTEKDWANTLVTEGYVDFGYIGFVLYLFLVVWLFHITLRLISNNYQSIYSFLYAAIFVVMVLLVESTLVSYFSFLRNIIFVSLIFSLFNLKFYKILKAKYYI